MNNLTKLKDIPTSKDGSNLLFENEINDSINLKNINIKFSLFRRIGMRDAKLQGGVISHSIMEDVYGRKGRFVDINFTGTVFRNCNFERAVFSSCILKYCEFTNTQLPYLEIINCLPMEPNLRQELAKNLKMNYIGLGEKKIADLFLDIEIKARQEEQWAIFQSNTDYYRNKYDWIDRLNNFYKYCESKLLGFLSGYGYKIHWVFFSFLTIQLLLTLILYFSFTEFALENGTKTSLSFLQAGKVVSSESIKFSHYTYSPQTTIAKTILFISRFIGIVYLGLLSATIYRKIARQ